MKDKTAPLITHLRRQHHELDARVGDLSRRVGLAPSEQALVKQLKKQRLRTRDRLAELSVV